MEGRRRGQVSRSHRVCAHNAACLCDGQRDGVILAREARDNDGRQLLRVRLIDRQHAYERLDATRLGDDDLGLVIACAVPKRTSGVLLRL